MTDFIEEHMKEFEKLLAKIISFKSEKGLRKEQNAIISFLTDLLTGMLDADVKVIDTKGAPIIIAKIKGESLATKLFYGHYDVMPAGSIDDWQSSPFTLEKRKGRFWGRGTGDNKGQLMAVIFGLYMYKKTHPTFPFNIQLVIEGEEEQGSTHLPGTIAQLLDDLLVDVDSAFVFDGSINQQAQHVLRLGNRGALGFEMVTHTALRDNHSGNMGNIMENAALSLLSVVNKMYDEIQSKVLIPGFYDGIREPNKQEITWLSKLPYDYKLIEKQTGVKKLPINSQDYYHKLMYEPTFNISGIEAGYTKKGMKTIIPHRASLKVDCRIVKNQNIKNIKAEIEKMFAQKIKSKELEIKYLVEIPASFTSSEAPDINRICKALEEIDGVALVEPVMPGTVPNYIWTDILQVPTYTIPLANFDQANHAPNENLTLIAFRTGIMLVNKIIENLAV
ncbi:M20/M25/M40 family metallo-hydrolase [Liquorilactobacillus cacaonum]|uniref:M20/M25/M40 family metallo-hydrolase n=1 Tax=Liquorilactobacillus cacaonum TaxID=483012 RepID=UPI00070DAC67|nr:M20/M25/M40 family metallo-hydrolase [Liquorilactobacillus cacaonum]